MASVLDLDLSRADAAGRYRAQVVESPGGEASETFELDAHHLLEGLEEFAQVLIASSVPSRRSLSRGEAVVREVGSQLFETLFAQGALAGLYRASRAVAVERGDSLRVVLRVNAPELAALPWECMFDESADTYICRRQPLVRYLPVASSPRPLSVSDSLRILVVIASPRGLEPLDVEKEKEDLTEALALPMARGVIDVRFLEHATWTDLHDALLSGSWHVVHFIGHGDFDVERDAGLLALENDAGRVHRVTADSFVDLLREAQPMPRLVVLNACESATGSSSDMFAGVAASIVRGGVSAVTAMQFGISDRAAIAFCRGFYASLGRGRGVDESVRSGRIAILGLGESCLEWITPTLYLRGREVRLFEIAHQEAGTPDHQRQPVATGDPSSAKQRSPALSPEVRDVHPVGEADGPAPAHPDRSDEIWLAAKRVGWGERPFKASLAPLATVTSPEEHILGCVRLSLTWLHGAVAVVTDQFLHIAVEQADGRAWQLFRDQIPQLSPEPQRLRIPTALLAGSVDLVGSNLVLDVAGHGRVEVPVIHSADSVALIQKYVTEARARGPAG